MPPLTQGIRTLGKRIVQKGQTIIHGKQPSQDVDLLEVPEQFLARQYSVTLEELCDQTLFTKKELCTLYRTLKEKCPVGYVDEYSFVEIMAHFFPLGESERYIQHVFRTFNPDEFGHVGFREMLAVLSMLSRGSIDDKLRWLFSLYDVEQDGVLTEPEIVEITDAIFDMLQADMCDGSSSSEQHASSAFKKLDAYDNGFVTLETFMKACKEDPDIMSSLSVFNTIIMVRG